MLRFDREFHQSDFERFKICPRMLYYRDVLRLKEEHISESALAGRAIHETIAEAHKRHLWRDLFECFLAQFEELVQETKENGVEVRQNEINLIDYRSMLEGYATKEWNREAEVLLAEKEFSFDIRPSSTPYRFAGRIDQVAPVGYRNGHGKPRRLSLTSGTITVRRPRVRGLEQRFESRVLPLFKRRTQEVGELLPELYLHGLALGDFELAGRRLLGEGAPLSPSSLARLKGQWQTEYETRKPRRLDDLNVVYVWADGLYVKAGLVDTKAALLVMIGALTDGRKVVLAVESGQRESKASWGMLLWDLSKRGLQPWRCTIADGALGLWAALGEQYPELVEQRCWNHKLVNVLDALPTKHQATASALLRTMPYAESQATCEALRDHSSPLVITLWLPKRSSGCTTTGTGW